MLSNYNLLLFGCVFILLYIIIVHHILLVRTMDTTYFHIDMILSTLSLSPHGFTFGLSPKRPYNDGDIVHTYKLMILPILADVGLESHT